MKLSPSTTRRPPFAAKNVLESSCHRGGAGAGRAGDCDDRMLGPDCWFPLEVLNLASVRPPSPRAAHACRTAASEGNLRRFVAVSPRARDLLFRSEHEADALMQLLGLDLQPLAPGARRAAVFDQHLRSGWPSYSEELPSGRRRRSRDRAGTKHPAAHQSAMRLGHQRGDPAHVEVGRAGRSGPPPFVDISLHGRLPAAVRRVDRKLAGPPDRSSGG